VLASFHQHLFPHKYKKHGGYRALKTRTVIREGWYLIISLFIGLVVLPWIILLFIFPVQYPWPGYQDFLEGLVEVHSPFPWVVATGPYLLLQGVRWIRWAMKSSKAPK
jgi:hypothetical protein